MSIVNSFDQQLLSMTTIIKCIFTHYGNTYSSQGSGFYYNEQTPEDSSKTGPQWFKLEKHWLVTNRHVVLPKNDGVESVPTQFTFFLRKNEGGTINWFPITLSNADLLARLKVHKDDSVDIAMIDITSFIHDIVRDISENKIANNIILPTSLSNRNLPGNQPITIDVTSDIVVASYPKEFYDVINKFPIVKSGIIASAWGAYFNGQPMFQIDAQLFPGSSGGLVISKPTNIAMIDGHLNYCLSKQFVFLGVYSGEYTWEKDFEIDGKKYLIDTSFGLGNVWYSNLIPEIITNGVSYSV